MDIFNKNIKTFIKTKIVYIFAIISFLIVGICGYFIFVKQEDNVIKEDSVVKAETKEEKQEKQLEKIKVDVKGAVKKPGVYELEKGSRVIDAINAADGLTDQANTSIINLSKILEDANVIVVYTDNDLKDVVMDKYVENNVSCPSTINDACILDSENISTSSSKKVRKNTNTETITNKTSSKKDNSSETNSQIININTATLMELQSLSGIGEAKAQAIISYREENGNFESIEDITNVPGIGDSMFEKIKNNITV